MFGSRSSPVRHVRSPWLLWAGGFVVLGVVLVVVVFRGVEWTGVAVRGRIRGSRLFYDYGGATYHLRVRSKCDNSTVYLHPSHPGTGAVVGNTIRTAAEVGLVVAPFVIAAVLVLVHLRRRAVTRREDMASLTQPFGHGLDPEFVQRTIAERDHPGR